MLKYFYAGSRLGAWQRCPKPGFPRGSDLDIGVIVENDEDIAKVKENSIGISVCSGLVLDFHLYDIRDKKNIYDLEAWKKNYFLGKFYPNKSGIIEIVQQERNSIIEYLEIYKRVKDISKIEQFNQFERYLEEKIPSDWFLNNWKKIDPYVQECIKNWQNGMPIKKRHMIYQDIDLGLIEYLKGKSKNIQ